MKKALIILLTLATFLHAQIQAPKTGCILAQMGTVDVHWKTTDLQGVFNTVTYHPVAKEGKNFRDILKGSTFDIDASSVTAKDTPLISAKIISIKADKRIKKQPRTGVIMMEITINTTTKQIPMTYSYAEEIMQAKGTLDLSLFQTPLSKQPLSVDVGFTMSIKAILCAVPHK